VWIQCVLACLALAFKDFFCQELVGINSNSYDPQASGCINVLSGMIFNLSVLIYGVLVRVFLSIAFALRNFIQIEESRKVKNRYSSTIVKKLL